MKKIVLVLCCFAVASTVLALPPVPGKIPGKIPGPKVNLTPAAVRNAYQKAVANKGGAAQLYKNALKHYKNLPAKIPDVSKGFHSFCRAVDGSDFPNLVRDLSVGAYFFPENFTGLTGTVARQFNGTYGQALTDLLFARAVLKADTQEAWELLSIYTQNYEVSGAFWEYVRHVAFERGVNIRVSGHSTDAVTENGSPTEGLRFFQESIAGRGPLAQSVLDPSAQTTADFINWNLIKEEIGQLNEVREPSFLGNAELSMLTGVEVSELAVTQEEFINHYLKKQYTTTQGKELYDYYISYQQRVQSLLRAVQEDMRTHLDPKMAKAYMTQARDHSFELLSLRKTYLKEIPENLVYFQNVLEELMAQLSWDYGL